jgi:hypothetical protein
MAVACRPYENPAAMLGAEDKFGWPCGYVTIVAEIGKEIESIAGS